jgi:hypothetical protein
MKCKPLCPIQIKIVTQAGLRAGIEASVLGYWAAPASRTGAAD